MRCPTCQGDNPADGTFCGHCGAPLARTCPHCQGENPTAFQFCGQCGHPLEGTPAGRMEPVIEEERKQVTVLFSDLSGYTAMSERLDPEEVKKIMNRIFGEITATVSKYGGTIQKFIGDAVVAFFGVPKVHEDDPVRAVRAAREMHELIEAISPHYEQQVGKRLALHTGINTGLVVTGEVTTGDGILGVTGDTVNLASRFSTLARPNEILVGQNTCNRAELFFVLEPLEHARVKGRIEPVRVYRIAGIKAEQRRAVSVASPLVGREREREQLALQVSRLVLNDSGGIVTVSGEPGIGKSRLLAEVLLTAAAQKTILLEGHALSMGRSLSFYPIIDALKHWAQIREQDTDFEAQWKLERAIRDLYPREAGEIFPFIATLMGMKLSGKSAQRVRGIEGEPLERLIVKSMRELLIRGAEVRPLVIYLEDFHWVDTSSLDLVKTFFRLVEEHRILFILAFRPGFSDTGEQIMAFLGKNFPTRWTKIELDPLNESDSERLLANLLHVASFPHQLREQILLKAGGNPFFIEEVVRSLINEGAVVLEKGEYRVTEKIQAVAIPQTLQALIMARIDRLDEETRNLVRIASVIGRNFFYRILVEVSGTIGEIDRRLDLLKEIQLIRERRRLEEVEYLFKHALTQEAAYESILIQRRKEIHQRVAESIENVFSERLHEFFGMLAYHYSKAENPGKAEEYLIKAGEEALKSSASNEALTYYQEALGVYHQTRGARADPDKVAMLEKNIGLALFNRGRYAEAVEYFDKALNYYWGALPKNVIARTLRFLTSLVSFLLALYFPTRWFKKRPGPNDFEAFDLFYKKGEALVVINPKRFFVEALFFYGKIVHFDLTQFKLGMGFFAGASSLFSFAGLSLRLGRKILDYVAPRLTPHDAKQWIVYDLMDTQHRFLNGQWSRIPEVHEELVSRNLKIGEMFYAAQHYYWHGLPMIYQGHFAAAESIVHRLNEIAEAYENDMGRLLKYFLNIHLLVERRHLQEAAAEVQRGIGQVRSTGSTVSTLSMLSLKAWIHLLADEQEEAQTTLETAERIRSEVNAVPLQYSFFYRSQFQYYLRRLEDSRQFPGRPESAASPRQAYHAGTSLFKTVQKSALFRVDCLRLMGSYYWLVADRKKAFRWWRKGISLGETMGARPQLLRTYVEIGRLAGGHNDELSALEAAMVSASYEKAEALARELGLAADQEDRNSAVNE